MRRAPNLALLLLFVTCPLLSAAEPQDAAGQSFADLPLTLTSFGAARLADTVYVFGGHTGQAHSYSVEEQSDRLLALDLTKPENPWREVSQSTRLQGLAMVAYGSEIIRVGGFSATNAQGEEHNLVSTDAVAAYDVEAGTWRDLPPLPQPRSSHDAVLIGSVLYVVGGWQLSGGTRDSQWHDTAYRIDLAAEKPQWQEIAKPPFKRRALSLAAYGDRLAAVGGMEPEGKITRDVMIYSPADDRWGPGPKLIGEGRMMGFGTAAISIGESVLVSAIDGSLQLLRPGSKEWVAAGKTEDARFFHELVSLEGDRILVLGGANMESGKFVDVDVVDVRSLPSDQK